MRQLNEQETVRRLKGYRLDQPSGPGFAFCDRSRGTAYGWHTHEYHQLIYTAAGATQVETADARYVLPAGGAAWIPAAVRHRTLIGDVEGVSLYFSPNSVVAPGAGVRVLIASPVMREMILHASQWPLGRSEVDPVAASFFSTLALMCGECLAAELPFSLPATTHAGVTRAMDHAFVDLAAASLPAALGVAAMSERTFRRTFLRETGLTWQSWLTRARILAGLDLLMQGRRVSEVAAEVGYDSLSAFAKAFVKLTGKSPKDIHQPARGTRVNHKAATAVD
jgi:AraC-like DNA-binding protein